MHPRVRLALATAALTCAAAHTVAEERPPLRVSVVPAPSAIVIDGRLNEAAWSVPPITTFVQRDPHQGAEPTEATELRIVYDARALYVGLHLRDRTPGGIGRRLSRRDAEPDADAVQIYVDPRRDGRSGAMFEVTAASVQRDALIFNDSALDFSWDAVWDSAVSIDERGWTAEVRIPLSQLRFSSERAGVWGLNVARYIRRTNEVDWLVLVPKRETHLAARMADMTGMPANPASTPSEVVAHGVARHVSGVDAGSPGPLVGALGADVKQGLADGLMLEATVNPDFSQVEGDPAMINLTAFETFLEERRPFFTESTPLFRTFGNSGGGFDAASPLLFYSRRIGQPPAETIEIGSVTAPAATPVWAAIKVAGVAARTWKLTFLDAVGGSTAGSTPTSLSDPRANTAAVTNYAAGRVLRETGRGGVGALATAVHRRVSNPSTLSSLVPEQSLVGGVDGYLFFDRDQEWVIGGQLSGSYLSWTPSSATTRTTASNQALAVPGNVLPVKSLALSDRQKIPPTGVGGGPPPDKPGKGPPLMRPGQNGSSTGRGNGPPSTVPGNGPPAGVPGGAARPVFGAGSATVNTGLNRIADLAAGHLGGWSANANLHRNSGAVRANVDAWAIDPGFETNDLGFLPRADIQGVQGEVSWSQFDPDAFTRFRSMSVSKGWTRTFAGEKQSDTLAVSSSAVFLNYWSAGAGVSTWRQAFDATMTRGGPSVLIRPGRSWWAWASTDGRHIVSLDFGGYRSSNDAGDTSTSTWMSATLKPNPGLTLSAGPVFDRSVIDAQYVATVHSGGVGSQTPHYVFAALRANNVALTARVNAIATARLSVQLYAQSLVATGRYTGFKRLAAPATDRFFRFGVDGGDIALDTETGRYVVRDQSSTFRIDNPDFDPALVSVHGVVRWEWQRGSTLYLVWTQRRSGSAGVPTAGASQLFQPFLAPPQNALMAKFTYWIGR